MDGRYGERVTAMSATKAEIKELARKYPEQAVNEGDLGVIDEVFADDYVSHSSGFSEPLDREGLKEFTTMARTAFSDLEMTVEDVIVEDDKVVRRDRITGTHDGEFMGIPPTGKEVDVESIEIFRFDDGQFTEARGLMDMMGLMQQLGVVEPLGE